MARRSRRAAQTCTDDSTKRRNVIVSAKVPGRKYAEQLFKRAKQSSASAPLVNIRSARKSKRKPDAIALTAGRPSSAQRIDSPVFTPHFEAELLSGWFRSPDRNERIPDR